MFLTFTSTIWLYDKPVDFRKQIDGLVMLVADQLKLDPASGQLFLFRNTDAKKIKMLWWDRNGFWLFYKRLEQERLIFPQVKDNVLELTRDQMSWLLSGLDYSKPSQLAVLTPKNFY